MSVLRSSKQLGNVCSSGSCSNRSTQRQQTTSAHIWHRHPDHKEPECAPFCGSIPGLCQRDGLAMLLVNSRAAVLQIARLFTTLAVLHAKVDINVWIKCSALNPM